MGYDLHIHRRKDWFNEGDEISLAEWRQICADDPSLDLTGTAEAKLRDGVLVYENEGCAVWKDASTGTQTWFDLRDGAIAVKNPIQVTIAKMCEIADKLSARVQGDDGEIYRPDGTAFEQDA